jgi:hypothetical protein
MCGMYRLGKRRAGGPVGQGSDTIHGLVPEAMSIGRPAADDAFRQRACLSTQCAASTTG